MPWEGVTLHEEFMPPATDPSVRATRTSSTGGGDSRALRNAGQRRGAEKATLVNRFRRDGGSTCVRRILGSRPLATHQAPEMSAEQREALRAWFEAQRGMQPAGSGKAMELRFRVLLLDRGDYVGGVNPKSGKPRNDGNVYNYARHFCKFFDAGVVRSEADLVPENRPAALAVARQHAAAAAPRQRVRGVEYAHLTAAQQAGMLERLCCNFMHGFDDFVSALEAERRAAAVRTGGPLPPPRCP